MDNRSLFEHSWDEFTNLVRGKLCEVPPSQNLTTGYANIILKDVASCWNNEYTAAGRWLNDFRESGSSAVSEVYNIILNEMRFNDTSYVPKKGGIDALDIIVPAAGAVAGFAISTAASAGTAVKVISTLVPAAALFVGKKSLNSGTSVRNKQIDEYMTQLEKYKFSILSAIDNN